jgi:hypothetical protein
VQAVGEGGVAGLALLAPSGDGTAVQVLVVGAPAGTTAVIHPGGCDAPDPTPIALLGDVGAGGQVQVTVPVPFETLADGGHLLAFHPGLDLTTLVGCGAIPAATLPPVPVDPPASPALPIASEAPPLPSLPPAAELVVPLATEASLSTEEPAPVATPDVACAGVPDWISGTEARLARIDEGLSDLNAIAGRYDLPAYLAGLASLEGELGTMATSQADGPVPAPALELNARVVESITTFMDAARQIYDSLTVSVDLETYSRAVGRYEAATALLGEVRRDLGSLKGRCPEG